MLTEIPLLTGAANISAGLRINPGQSLMFTWLAGQAALYTHYRFRRYVIHILPEVSSATDGYMGVAVDYDSTDAPPSTKAEFYALPNAVRGPVWNSLRWDALAHDLTTQNQLYVNTTLVPPAGTDIKTYDIGKLYFITGGLATAKTAEVWVDYEIELFTPKRGQLAAVLGGFADSPAGTPSQPLVGAASAPGQNLPYEISGANYDRIVFNEPGAYEVTITGSAPGQVLIADTATDGTSTATVISATSGVSGNQSFFTQTFYCIADIAKEYLKVKLSDVYDNVSSAITTVQVLPMLTSLIPYLLLASEQTGPRSYNLRPELRYPGRVRLLHPTPPVTPASTLADSVLLTPEQKAGGKWLKL